MKLSILSAICALALLGCSKDSNNFKLQCYGSQSVGKDNKLVDSQSSKKYYQFVNQAIPEHTCTSVDKTIQCSKITDDGKANINHYLIFDRSLGTIYDTTITTTKTKDGEAKTKEVFQGKCESPII